MKSLLLIISFSLITGCAGQIPQERDLKGNWIHENIKLWAEFKFLDNNVCGFSSGSKFENNGVRIPCKYVINEEYIEIYQTDQKSNRDNKIFILEYDSFSNLLLLKKSEKDHKPLIFIKK